MILASKWVRVLLPTNSFWVLHSKLLLSSVHPQMLSFFSTFWNLSAVSLLFLSFCFIPHSLKIVCSFFIALPPLNIILQIVCSFWLPLNQCCLVLDFERNLQSWLYLFLCFFMELLIWYWDQIFGFLRPLVLIISQKILELVQAKTTLSSISTTHN